MLQAQLPVSWPAVSGMIKCHVRPSSSAARWTLASVQGRRDRSRSDRSREGRASSPGERGLEGREGVRGEVVVGASPTDATPIGRLPGRHLNHASRCDDGWRRAERHRQGTDRLLARHRLLIGPTASSGMAAGECSDPARHARPRRGAMSPGHWTAVGPAKHRGQARLPRKPDGSAPLHGTWVWGAAPSVTGPARWPIAWRPQQPDWASPARFGRGARGDPIHARFSPCEPAHPPTYCTPCASRSPPALDRRIGMAWAASPGPALPMNI